MPSGKWFPFTKLILLIRIEYIWARRGVGCGLLNQFPYNARLEWFCKRDTKITRTDMQIRIRRRAVLILAAGCALLAAGIQAQEIRDGEMLLRAMHDRYQRNWYETLTFTQKSTTHNDDGTDKSEIWHEPTLPP